MSLILSLRCSMTRPWRRLQVINSLLFGPCVTLPVEPVSSLSSPLSSESDTLIPCDCQSSAASPPELYVLTLSFRWTLNLAGWEFGIQYFSPSAASFSVRTSLLVGPWTLSFPSTVGFNGPRFTQHLSLLLTNVTVSNWAGALLLTGVYWRTHSSTHSHHPVNPKVPSKMSQITAPCPLSPNRQPTVLIHRMIFCV